MHSGKKGGKEKFSLLGERERPEINRNSAGGKSDTMHHHTGN